MPYGADADAPPRLSLLLPRRRQAQRERASAAMITTERNNMNELSAHAITFTRLRAVEDERGDTDVTPFIYAAFFDIFRRALYATLRVLRDALLLMPR